MLKTVFLKIKSCIRRLIFLSLILLFYPFNFVFADVLISGFSNFALSPFTGHGDVSGSSTLCVCSDNNAYNVTVLGSGAGNAFSLISGSHSVSYSVYWNDSASSSGKVQLASNIAQYNMTTSYKCDQYDCNGTKNAYLEIVFSERDLLAAIRGSYIGSITVIVEPN